MTDDPYDPIPIRVAVGIAFRGEEILLAQRSVRGSYGGLWEFPGGKIEDREKTYAALIREWQEELGVTPTIVPVTGKVTAFARFLCAPPCTRVVASCSAHKVTIDEEPRLLAGQHAAQWFHYTRVPLPHEMTPFTQILMPWVRLHLAPPARASTRDLWQAAYSDFLDRNESLSLDSEADKAYLLRELCKLHGTK